MSKTFEERTSKFMGMDLKSKEFQDGFRKEIEEHLLEDGISARAIAEVIAVVVSKIKWR